MNRFRKFMPLVAVLVGAVVFGAPTPAQAAFMFEVKISDQTGVPTTKTYTWVSGTDIDGNPQIVVSDTVGDFSVNFEIVVTNSPGGPSIAFLSQSANSVKNNASSSQTINITASATDYTTPTTPPDLILGSALSGTVTNAATVSGVTFNSYIGAGNALYEQSIAGQTVGPTSATGPSGSLSGETHTLVTLLSSPYSLTNSLTATFSGKAMVTNLSGNTTLTTTPAPGAVLLVLSAMPLFGLGWLRRRRALLRV